MLSSLFASRAYYAFGFLALTAGVVALTTATVTILFTYFLLCAEEYRCVSFHAMQAMHLLISHVVTGGTGERSLQEAEAPSGFWDTVFSTGCLACPWILSLASCYTWDTCSFWPSWISLLPVCTTRRINTVFETLITRILKEPSAFWRRIGLSEGCTALLESTSGLLPFLMHCQKY